MNRERDELRDELALLRDLRHRALATLAASLLELEARNEPVTVDELVRHDALHACIAKCDAEIERLDPRARWGRGD